MTTFLPWTTTPDKVMARAKARALEALKRNDPSKLTKLELAYYQSLKR